MSVCSLALYQCLIDDTERHLDYNRACLARDGKKVPLYPDDSLTAVAVVSLLNSFYKKSLDEVAPDADAKAVSLFMTANNRCKEWKLEPLTMVDEYLIGEFRQSLIRFFETFVEPQLSFASLHANGMLGPGANIKARGTDLYTKLFSSPLSCSSASIHDVYMHHVEDDHRWLSAELNRQAAFGDCIFASGSRLSCVPKTRDVSRTICTEPTLNMFYQLGYGTIIERSLRQAYSINLSEQPFVNAALARLGSLDGSYATIDLKSASDSVSKRLIEVFVPRLARGYLSFCRTPTCFVGDSEVELHMWSTMGNGYTFPLQTAIFTSVVAACYSLKGLSLKRSQSRNQLGNFGVFGDDIIVVKETYDSVTRLLSLLGFTVNSDKSFNDGSFRESCGSDFMSGRNVRGVYLKTLLTPQDRCSAANRLLRWSCEHKVLLKSTVQCLLTKDRFLPVPRWEQDDAGVHVPKSFVRDMRLDPNVQSIVYKRWTVRQRSLRVLDSQLVHPGGERPRIFNSEGLGLAFLHGSLRANAIPIRLDRKVFVLKTRIAPGWDAYPVSQQFSAEWWRSWETTVCDTLFDGSV